MKENPSILVGSLAIKLLYAGNAGLFVLFFSKSFDVVSIAPGGYYGCDFVYPDYISKIAVYSCLAYLWTILLCGQMRLSVIATIVGSWHFHQNDMPSVFKAITNIFTSYGTLSVSSLIATIAERFNRYASRDAWESFISPTICITFPCQCFMCVFGSCIHTSVKMFTDYAVVLHVFSGKNFVCSAKKAFNILSRHFEGGFVTEITSRSLFNLASYAFSFCVALIAWVWIDAAFDTNTFGDVDSGYVYILYFIGIIFNLYYPVLGLYLLIFINKILRDWEKSKMNDVYGGEDDDYYIPPTNHLWVPPLAGTFVGCLSMMFFTFVSDIFLDIISTLFLCFAIDKDHNVDLTNDEFESLAKNMSNYTECVVSTIESANTEDDPEAFQEDANVPVAIPVPSAPPKY